MSLELIKAAFRKDDANLLRQVLEQNPELKATINEPLFSFDSPAITQAQSRQMLDALLEAGADINGRSTWWAGGFGLLDSAEPKLAAYAIERGARVDAHSAARLGMLERLRELISTDPALVHARGGDGQTPLHFASTVEIAQYLLANGADINARDIDHESTPAQYMIRDRQPVARYLVGRGCKTDILMAAALGDGAMVAKFLDADPNSIRTAVNGQYFPKQNPHAGGSIYIWTLGSNKTAHQIAHEFGHDAIYRLLMERSPAEMQLAIACQLGDEKIIQSLLAQRPNLAASLTPDDQNKLAIAAQANDTAAVLRMLSVGWPVNTRGQHGGTPLHWAAFHGNAAMIEAILRRNPALEDAMNEFQSSPLGWATHGSEHGWHSQTGDYAKTVELLLAAGAAPPAKLGGTDAVKDVIRRHKDFD